MGNPATLENEASIPPIKAGGQKTFLRWLLIEKVQNG
jgi:hypothetical protein